MRYISFILKTVLASLSIANATDGEIKIVNNLSCPVYLQSISNTAGPVQTLTTNGGCYNEDWQTNPDRHGYRENTGMRKTGNKKKAPAHWAVGTWAQWNKTESPNWERKTSSSREKTDNSQSEQELGQQLTEAQVLQEHMHTCVGQPVGIHAGGKFQWCGWFSHAFLSA